MSGSSNYERQSSQTGSKSWSLRFFLLSINLFMFFLILQITLLREIGVFLLAISAFILIGKSFSNRNSTHGSRDDLRDFVPLMVKYLRINKRYILAAILGLSIAILIISQIFILSSSNSAGTYSQALSDGQVPFFEGRIWDESNIENANFTSIRSEISETFSQTLSSLGVETEEIIVNYQYAFRPTDINLESYWTEFRSEAISERQFNILSSFPSFPSGIQWHENLTIWIVSDYLINDGILPSNIETDYHNFEFTSNRFDSEQAQNNFTIDFDGVWVVGNNEYNYAQNNYIGELLWSLENTVASPELFIPKFYSNLDVELDIWGHTVRGYVNIDSLSEKSVDEVLQNIQVLLNELYVMFNNELDGFFDLYSPAYWYLQDIELVNAGIISLLLLLSLPMLGISMYLVYFSLNLVELRKQNLVAIMKIRGISSSQLQFMMFAETILTALISSALGMFMSIGSASYILDRAQIYGEATRLTISFDWYWSIPVIGIILALDLSIGSILEISSTNVEEGENQEEIKEPFWRRLYLDVIFSVLGLGIWFIIRFVPLEPQIYQILLGLGLYALFFLVIGLPLLVSRYYSSFLSFISDFLWVREGNLLALATRNMRKNKYSASKLAVLLMMGMMFSFIALGVPHSVDEWSVESANYQIGADFNIAGLNTSNITQMQTLHHQDIASTTTYQIQIIGAANALFNSIKIIGIDPNSYASTAYWQNDYADDDIQDLMDELSEDKVLIEENALNILNQEVGDEVAINADSSVFSLEVGGDFKYWPLLVDYLYIYNNYIDTVHIVMSLEKLNEIAISSSTINILAKAIDGTNHTRIENDLISAFEGIGLDTASVDSVASYLSTFNQDPITTLLYTIFETLFVITIITTIIGVSYFSFVTLSERRREIGVFRAVGMVSNQIFLLLIVESIILVVSSILIGILAGSFISSNIFYGLASVFGGNSIPPIDLKYPPLLTSLFVIGTIILSIFAAAIPARSTANRQTGSILRAD